MVMKALKDVAERLRSIRKEKHWSQAEMAAAAELSRVTVARMETQATNDMSLRAVLKLLDSAGYELKIAPKKKGEASAKKQAEAKRSAEVRRYLALIQSAQPSSPLKLEFAYNWSNQYMPDETFIRKVLDKGRFHDLAVICKKYGLERVRTVAGDKISASPSLKRSIANIEQGFAHAKTKHTA